MADIEQKALAQAVAAAGRRMQDYAIMAEENVLRQSIEAHARAIEQHEAFKREVSDAVEEIAKVWGTADPAWGYLRRFIIAKPDPLVEAIREMALTDATPEDADRLRAALAARGGRIVWEGE